MSNIANRRHDISDQVWNLLESYLPGRKGLWSDKQKIIGNLSMVYYEYCVLCAPWRDLPPYYGC